MKTKGKCKLCRQAAVLVDSHVVPRALHNDIRIPGDELRFYATDQRYSKRSRTGAYGKFLCKGCEDSFAPYDQYGVEFVRNHKNGKTGQPLWDSFSSGFVVSVDYVKFKLWVLSILWRAHACNHESYRATTLDRQRAQQLTECIKKRSPGPSDRFAIVVMQLDEAPMWHRSWIAPRLVESWGESENGTQEVRDACLLYLPGGFKFLIHVDEREPLPVWEPVIFREDGQLRVVRSGFSPDEISRLDNLRRLGPPR